MIATAGLATVAGFAVLVLSPIPMVRGFALLLVLGLVVAFALALTVGLSALSLLKRPTGEPARPIVFRRAGAPLRARRCGLGSRARAVGGRALAFSIAAPGRVLAVAALVAILGWGAGTRIPVISDIRQLVPGDLPALQDVDELEQATGISGLTYVTVTAPELSDPAVISWMHDFEQRILARHGFEGGMRPVGTEQTEICPEISLRRLPLRGRAGHPEPAADQGQPAPASSVRRPGARHHGPRHRQARQHRRDHLRDQGDAVRPAEGADRRHPRSGRPTGGRR